MYKVQSMCCGDFILSFRFCYMLNINKIWTAFDSKHNKNALLSNVKKRFVKAGVLNGCETAQDLLDIK